MLRGHNTCGDMGVTRPSCSVSHCAHVIGCPQAQQRFVTFLVHMVRKLSLFASGSCDIKPYYSLKLHTMASHC